MELIEIIENFNIWLEDFLMDAGFLAPLLSTLLIFLEGILAFLPLFIFITVNFLTMGPILGGLLAWIFTVLGCFTTFILCKKGFSSFFEKKISDKNKIKLLMDKLSKLSFCSLVLIISIPFTPSFFVNLAAGLSGINSRKYLYALMIGKIFVVIFCGYIGCNLLECFTNPVALIKVIAMVVSAYIIGRIVNKKFNLDERY